MYNSPLVSLFVSWRSPLAFFAGLLAWSAPAVAQSSGWYTEGNFAPPRRLKVTLVNALDIERKNCPVVITRGEFPVKKLHEMSVTVVDPSLPSKPEPTKDELAFVGGHGIRAETNGHQLFYQLDDLDKDGIWDELFFQTDLAPRQQKTLYIYFGHSGRGWNPHGTQALIGSYCRHMIAWWESKHIGWKLWYPTSVDMYAKRKGVLMAHEMCTHNYCGYYGVPKINPDYGSDVMTVSRTFGAGGIALYEHPDKADQLSLPRFTNHPEAHGSFNADQLTDTRYAFDVVVNGPVRSIIRVKTMNWDTGNGYYELVQDYTAYTNQSYSTCRVRFTQFLPRVTGVSFACGIKAHTEASGNHLAEGVAIRMGPEDITNPDDDTGQKSFKVPFVGSALVVRNAHRPQYQRSGENHTFRIPVDASQSYEYLIAGAWSEGEVYNTPATFKAYVEQTALEYNNPVTATFGPLEEKAK